MSEWDEFLRLLHNVLGLPVLAVLSFAVGIATVVLGVRHGLTWADMNRAAKKDPELRNKVFGAGFISIFAFVFLGFNEVALHKEDLKITLIVAAVAAFGGAFIFLEKWDKFVKLAEAEKSLANPNEAKPQEPKNEPLYDRLKSLRERAAKEGD